MALFSTGGGFTADIVSPRDMMGGRVGAITATTKESPQDLIDRLLRCKPAIPSLSSVATGKQPIPKKFAAPKHGGIPKKQLPHLGQTPSYSSSTPVSFQAQLRDKENASFFNRAPKQYARPIGQDRRSERAKQSSLGSGHMGAFEDTRSQSFGSGMGGARPASRADAKKLMRRRDTKARVSRAAQRSAEETRKFFDR